MGLNGIRWEGLLAVKPGVGGWADCSKAKEFVGGLIEAKPGVGGWG